MSFFSYWLPWYTYLSAIFIFSSFPRPSEVMGIPILDAPVHAAEFFFLPILTFRAFRNSSWRFLAERFGRMGFLFSLFYAATDEVHQFFVPSRSASLADLGWDWTGIFLGALVYRAVKTRDQRVREALP
jgi:VanZ family protein